MKEILELIDSWGERFVINCLFIYYVYTQTKHISQNWAIDMIAEEPVIPYDGRTVMCDGTHGGVAKEQVI